MHRCVALTCKGIIQPWFICQGAPGQVQPKQALEHCCCCCCWVLFAVRGMLTWVLEQVGLWDDPVQVILWFFKGSSCCVLDAEQRVLGNGCRWRDGVELLAGPGEPLTHPLHPCFHGGLKPKINEVRVGEGRARRGTCWQELGLLGSSLIPASQIQGVRDTLVQFHSLRH